MIMAKHRSIWHRRAGFLPRHWQVEKQGEVYKESQMIFQSQTFRDGERDCADISLAQFAQALVQPVTSTNTPCPHPSMAEPAPPPLP